MIIFLQLINFYGCEAAKKNDPRKTVILDRRKILISYQLLMPDNLNQPKNEPTKSDLKISGFEISVRKQQQSAQKIDIDVQCAAMHTAHQLLQNLAHQSFQSVASATITIYRNAGM